MELTEAWHHLGIEPTQDLDEIRSAYLARLHLVHPDKATGDAAEANDRTIALTTAYRVAVDLSRDEPAHADPGGHDRPGGRAGPSPDAPGSRRVAVVPIAMVENDTIAVALPPDATYALVVEAAHRLGEVTHIEPSSGLLQVVLEFVEAPPCSLLVSLQGRATGVTEAFCTVESLEAQPAPPIDAVVSLLLDEMVAVSGR
jgi:hypothetical protein